MEENEYPIFYLDFDDNIDNAGMDAVSFVDKPATKIKWEVFAEMEDSYNDYPELAKKAACRALKYKEENPDIDCGTRVGWTRANQLCNGRNITIETIARMASFARHLQHKDVPYKEGCGGLMVDAWGSEIGINWAIRKMEYINNRLRARAFQVFETIDDEKRIVSAPVMLAETPILRFNENIGKYYVKFSPDTIERMMKKYFKENKIHNVNLNHNSNQQQDNIYMVESYIVGDRNKSELFKDIPNGSWVASFVVENDDVWEKIKSGEYKGFSLEGHFIEKYEDEMINNIEAKIIDIVYSQMPDTDKETKLKKLLNL